MVRQKSVNWHCPTAAALLLLLEEQQWLYERWYVSTGNWGSVACPRGTAMMLRYREQHHLHLHHCQDIYVVCQWIRSMVQTIYVATAEFPIVSFELLALRTLLLHAVRGEGIGALSTLWHDCSPAVRHSIHCRWAALGTKGIVHSQRFSAVYGIQ